ncbi:MAG: hypothetical protein CL609_08885 [Anaerolineaceae bacterium]|nr:hypothetical protein [Anaerolineaceae bacterium]
MPSDRRRLFVSASGEKQVSIDSAKKLFQLSKNIGVTVLSQSVFYTELAKTPHLKLSKFFQKLEETLKMKSSGVSFYVGGHNSSSFVGELYSCTITGEIYLQRTTEDAGMILGFRGEFIILRRFS